MFGHDYRPGKKTNNRIVYIQLGRECATIAVICFRSLRNFRVKKTGEDRKDRRICHYHQYMVMSSSGLCVVFGWIISRPLTPYFRRSLLLLDSLSKIDSDCFCSVVRCISFFCTFRSFSRGITTYAALVCVNFPLMKKKSCALYTCCINNCCYL
jgi:hypothetical protein